MAHRFMSTILIIFALAVINWKAAHAATLCPGGKSCKYSGAPSGEMIEYDICAEGLTDDGECPPDSDKMFISCNVENYKKNGEYGKCIKCMKNGQSCTQDSDCCQSYVRSKAAANLPVIMFQNCINNKCAACLKDKYPCGKGSSIPCCGKLEGRDGISCREERDVSTSPFLPQIWPICAPAPCNQAALTKMELFQATCFSYGESYPQYDGINMCSCDGGENDSGYNCKGNKCVKCKLEGFDTASQCTSDADCCEYHECRALPEGNNGKSECFQQNCVLEGQRDSCDGQDESGNDRRCCDDDLRCLVVTKDDGTRDYSICTREKCTEYGSECYVNYHCCEGLKCIKRKVGSKTAKFCLKE